MKGYIDREAVEKMLEDAQIITYGEWCGYCTEDINLDSIPAADVAPVRHGRWIPEIRHTYVPVAYDERGEPVLHEYAIYRCSLCGREETKKEPYCHCGALMDGEEDGHGRM